MGGGHVNTKSRLLAENKQQASLPELIHTPCFKIQGVFIFYQEWTLALERQCTLGCEVCSDFRTR